MFPIFFLSMFNIYLFIIFNYLIAYQLAFVAYNYVRYSRTYTYIL